MVDRPVTKLYVDSRFAILRSPMGGVCDFHVDGGIALHPHSKVFLSELCCINAWPNFDQTNERFYIMEEGGASWRWLLIPWGAHDLESLISVLEELLNDPVHKPVSMGDYTVSRVGTGSSGSSSFTKLRIVCDAGAGFQVLDDTFLRETLGISNPRSTNAILKFPSGVPSSSHNSTFVDIRKAHTVYVHASSLGGYNSIGPQGSRTIIAKIPVNVGYGELLQWQSSGSEHDCLEAGISMLTTMRLALRDVHGNELDLDGTHWSATILFER